MSAPTRSLRTWRFRRQRTLRENAAFLSEDAVRRGVYQVSMLTMAYVTPQARNAVRALCEEFHLPLAQALEEAH